MHLFKMKICLALLYSYLIPIQGNAVLTVEPQEFQDGNKCTITCSTETLTDIVFFQHPVDATVGSCPVVGATCVSYKYDITQDIPRKKTILTINSYSKSRDDGVWICEYLGKASNTLTLQGIHPVQQITMNGTNPVVVHEGSTVTIMCTTSPSRPAAYVVWSKDMDNITSYATAVVEHQAGDKYVTRSYLSLTVNRGDEGKTVKCEGYNGAPNKVSDSATLDIWYVARPANKPALLGYANGTALLEDSTAKRELTCRQSDCNPLCTLTWDCEGLTGTNKSTQTESVSVIQVPLQRQYNGKACTCMSRHISLPYTDHVSVIFTVYHSPSKPSISVSPTFPWLEKTRGSLQCTVADKGNPSFTHYTWLDGSTAIAGHNGETLTIDILTNLDHGKQISCKVKNAVSAAMTSAVVTLNVEYSPILTLNKNNLTIIEGGRAVRICAAEGNPEPNVKWIKGSTVVGGSSGTKAILTIQNISMSETGVYSCYAEAVSAVAGRNKLSSFQDINVIVLRRPHRPFGIRAVCTSINTAEVIWISKFNGGSIEHFNIFVSVTKNVLFKKKEKISDPGKDEIVSAIVDNLHDGTQYFFTVYAENDYSQSALTDVLNCTTPKKAKDDTGPSTASIVLFVLSSIFIVCGTMAFAVTCFVKRRKHKLEERKKIHDKALDLTNTYQDLGEREQPVDKPYQEIGTTAAESRKDERNAYQEISGRDSLDKQYQQMETIIGQPPGSNKGNVYEEPTKRDIPNVYEKMKC